MTLLSGDNALSFEQGASKTLQVTIQYPDGKPVVLQDVKLIFTMKRKVEDALPLIVKTSDLVTEILITNIKAGKARIYIQSGDTAWLTPQDYTYDIWLIFTLTNKRHPVVRPSVLELTPSVTRFASP